MTAAPGTKPAPKPDFEIPAFGIYRATTAHWADGTIKLLYSKIKGQGRQVLIEELPGEDPVELGNRYQLVLQRIEDGEPVPPIDMPEFPALPENPIAPIPPEYEKPEQPIYKPEPPDYPGVKPPIYEKPPEGVEKPIYKPGDKPDAPDRPQPK